MKTEKIVQCSFRVTGDGLLGMVKRKACSKNKLSPDNVKEQFLLDIKQLVDDSTCIDQLGSDCYKLCSTNIMDNGSTREQKGRFGWKRQHKAVTACFAG